MTRRSRERDEERAARAREYLAPEVARSNAPSAVAARRLASVPVLTQRAEYDRLRNPRKVKLEPSMIYHATVGSPDERAARRVRGLQQNPGYYEALTKAKRAEKVALAEVQKPLNVARPSSVLRPINKMTVQQVGDGRTGVVARGKAVKRAERANHDCLVENRPKSNKGAGGSRFVPWCSTKRSKK